jgi:ABC-type glycerol-3-phosphate transport system permease component
VKLTVPVSDTSASKAQIYYLKADGSVGVSSELVVSNGAVTFTLSELGLMSNARGNLVVAVVQVPAETPEDPTDNPEDPATDNPAAADTPTTNTGSGLTGSSGTTGSGLTGSTGSGLTGSSGTTGSGLTGADDNTSDTDLTSANGSSGLKSVDDSKTPLASDGDADDAIAGATAATGGIGQWLLNNLILAIIVGVVVLLALAATAWLLVRRHRHRLINAESGDAPDEPEASGGGSAAAEEWLSMA